MTPERHALIREVFVAAVSQTPSERPAFLDDRCGNDADLRSEVERLLEHHRNVTISRGLSDEAAVTYVVEAAAKNSANQTAQTSPSRSSETARTLTPGTIVAGRFRVVAPLGEGGMGVVYRCEDLTLGQTVALKFLNPSLSASSQWLQRFRNEVRLARQVSHPSVCRVFDIGEVDGQWFLSMEYIEGEDLKRLIRRIGRVAREKAIQIARETCIGLAAAHGANVLHRDLKPGNIMLDENGRVRITDFGLAAPLGSVQGAEILAGTPAYMAPEQISGQEVTTRSDLYSLGLVLYELFSGRQAFEADSALAYRDLHERSHPTPLSQLVPELEPSVERVITRCLAKKPEDRPPSALAVAAALPGVDALEEALAAHLTPPPDLVAAGSPIAPARLRSVTLLAIVLGLLACVAVARVLVPLPFEKTDSKPPEVMLERAREVVHDGAESSRPFDTAHGYAPLSKTWELTRGMLKPGPSEDRPVIDPRNPIVFWYRVGRTSLAPRMVDTLIFGMGRTTPFDPPPMLTDSASVVLDLSGRLLQFVNYAQTINADERVPSSEGADWRPLFDAAGLDMATARPLPSAPVTEWQFDKTQMWEAPSPADRTTPVQVQAAEIDSRPVLFRVTTPDATVPVAWDAVESNRPDLRFTAPMKALLLVIIVASAPFAWRNLRRGNGDVQGAIRFGGFLFVFEAILWLLEGVHSFDPVREIRLLSLTLRDSAGIAAIGLLLYLALEPLGRRFWPHTMIAWSRILSGQWRDAVVGRHVLVGVGLGCLWAVAVPLNRALIEALGHESSVPVMTTMCQKLLGGRPALAAFGGTLIAALGRALLFLLLLGLLRAWLGRASWAVIATGGVLFSVIVPDAAYSPATWLTLGLIGIAPGLWAMVRYGLVTLTAALFVFFTLNTSPFALSTSVWFSGVTVLSIAIVGAIALYGYVAAQTRYN